MKKIGLALIAITCFIGLFSYSNHLSFLIDLNSFFFLFALLFSVSFYRFGKDGILFWKVENLSKRDLILKWHMKQVSALLILGFQFKSDSIQSAVLMYLPAITVSSLPFFYAFIYRFSLEGILTDDENLLNN